MRSDLDLVTVISPRPQKGFIETPCVKELTDRALRYIKAGYPVHLSGPTGCGKTTLAMHIAYNLGRPVVLINGDEEFSTSSLVGGEFGYRRRKVVDRFVSRVYKSDESMTKMWVDDRLTTACKYGFTLIYNEFTRSRPEANNALLSVLEEGMLELPSAARSGNYIKVHPDFSTIFTSNPEEYAGVFRSQDALLDRMITINMGYYDEETEIAITRAKTELPYEDAKKIVRLVRRLRESDICELTPTVRSCIMIVRTIRSVEDDSFRQACIDVLSPRIGRGKTGDLDPIAVIDDMLVEEGIVCR
ncbi:MAG: gas vesicle protein GvpN [Methanophagales archaeon]|nr:gas vesicle protein GvpN [Methanophagales archaeon]